MLLRCRHQVLSVRGFASAAKTTPPSHQQRIYKSAYPPIPATPVTTWQLVQQAAKIFADAPALICGISHKHVTYREFEDTVLQVASSLSERGVAKGDVVLTNMINCIEYPVLYHALTSLGAILSPAPPSFSGAELAQQLKASNAKFVVTHDSVENAATDAAKSESIPTDHIFSVGSSPSGLQSFSELQQPTTSSSTLRPEVIIHAHKDVNYLPFSSGTTGPPKGVRLSFWNLAVNALQWQTIDKFTSPALAMLPYNHIYGTTLMNGVLLSGQPQVILPKFDPVTFLQALQQYKIQKAHIVPPLAAFLAKHPLVDEYDLSATTTLVSGAAPMGHALEQAVKDRLGISIKQAYGMTELSPVATYSHDSSIKSSSSGNLVPNTELRVVCPSSGADLPPHALGELWYRGPQVMLGYLNNHSATEATMTSCGFMKTGDLGYIDDDGHVYVVDRLKELIKYKGHQVAPAELEDVILKHPSVLDVACIRGYDDNNDEVPKACVVLKPHATLSAKDLMAYVAASVAPYKKVRQVEFVDAIPKSPSGKILRRELQAAHE
ncbi:hypothetical protein H257_14454 [Aphanomyces astaci]|uniref:4-coumarate-CoA ligase n=1 Tax=Aphanomyces astaci TaxID=112090 RepID=W4FSA3_APHAT|nr:hypothetical protein H257_14454 [Aphanomyces astaci]ETV69831.1 hypothetical protein H257_14454 [Aphanomyces astaci]|eukprot:XP_009840569.1 hypothetical protein H257_14454 [Aphanomyces astaci]